MEERSRFCISDADVMILADYAIKVENHYSERVGMLRPMDMEWAKDGMDGCLYMVQARPETVESQKQGNILEIYHLKEHSAVLAQGKAIGARIGAGKARVIDQTDNLADFKPGEVLVADSTSPDWEPVMKRAAAIVTNRGGRTCHAAIVARELGVPTIVGTGNATAVLRDGEDVTICCAEGELGNIHAGILPFEIEHADLGQLAHPRTKIMMNVGNPDQAFSFASLPVDGFSIGSNDLTQLTLGVDRDSEIVAFDFDERDPGVLDMIRMAVEGARRNGRHAGICGQAPSDYPELTEFLVQIGIDSISLNPDTVLASIRHVLEVEQSMTAKQKGSDDG